MAVAWMAAVDQLAVTVRPYRGSDHASLTAMLSPTLSSLYPNGCEWLQRRLSEVAPYAARCDVAVVDGTVVGTTIETPKPKRRLKLSTLFVAESWRGLGVGRALVSSLMERWADEDWSEVYVTAAEHVADRVEVCLSPASFARVALVPDRYGPGRNEAVLAWVPTR